MDARKKFLEEYRLSFRAHIFHKLNQGSIIRKMLETSCDNSASSKSPDALLEVDFQPSPYSVICGRGKICFDALGNRRLKVTASLFMHQYSEGNKVQKSEILSNIIDITKASCPLGRGAFIRFIDGRWWEVDNNTARDKVGCVLRDCLHDKYRSSSKSKIAKRKIVQPAVSDICTPVDSRRQPFYKRSDLFHHEVWWRHLTSATFDFESSDQPHIFCDIDISSTISESKKAKVPLTNVTATASDDPISFFLDDAISLVTNEDDMVTYTEEYM